MNLLQNPPFTEQAPDLFGETPPEVRRPAEIAVPQPTGRLVRVQLEGSAAMELDYVVPERLEASIIVGSRVQVPLQGQRVPAVVIAQLTDSPFRGKLKEIASVVGTRPMFTPGLLRLARWIADYYIVPPHQVLRTMLPQAVRTKPETFLSDSRLQLLQTPDAEKWEKLQKTAPLQIRILDLLKSAGGEMRLSELRRELPQASTVIKALLKNGWISRSELRVERDPFQNEEFMPSAPLQFTDEQQSAFDAILPLLEKPAEARPILLEGVTGSGKTEVYLQIIAQVLARGQTALVLVPEISLTPQTIERFKSRFSDRKERIAVLHSHLSEGERHDEWFKVQEGRADIVIGARSAIFAPLERLGIIIVDEEHEPSYKQDENPRYHARDVAVVRAKLENCLVLLGSATPSLESYENARRGKYELLRLTRRTDGKTLPYIRIVDMRLQRRKGTGTSVANAGILSEVLRKAVESRLEKREQTILFLNRRGFNTSVSCTACGEVVQCQECSIPMTLHKKDQRLVCHVCGARRLLPKICPFCQEKAVQFTGYGTERVEEVVREVFPKARIARVDTDTIQRKNQLRDLLRDFRAQKLDILIGTQMIAKGLDFPNVTLVGVLNADIALNMPDFRAAERTLQLLVQVAGRAGRGEVKGEVVVQTYAPHTPAVQFARHNDFDGFAQQEIEHRQAFRYPPFTHVVLIHARGKNQSLAEFALQTLHRRLAEKLPEGTLMGEPAPAALAKAHGQFRYQLLLRSEKIRPLARHIQQIVRSADIPPEVTVVWDVDPVSLL
jgi:primosomal protein N' (replication factor Y)